MNKIIHFISILTFFAAAFLIIYGNHVSAASSATVTATVTAQEISVSVADGSVAYGTLAVGTTENTTTNGIDDSQTATNDGNVTEDFNIRGQDTANWTLAGTAGADQYTHSFCTSNCDSTPSWTNLTTSNQSLAASVASSGTQIFDLELGTPSSTSNYTQQSVDVIVQASAS